MKIKNLSLSFGIHEIFKNVNLDIPENEKVGIVGVNGAGKSTFFKLIMKRLEPDEGKIIIKEDYNIDIICGSFVHDRKEEILNKGEKYRLINSERIKYHVLSGVFYRSKLVRMFSMIQFFFKALRFSKKLKDKPDIIYASSPHPFNGLAGMYLARKYKCPFILEIRDLWPETWIAMGVQLVGREYFSLL